MNGSFIDLSGVDYIDAHIHPPLQKPHTGPEGLYNHWYEGPRSHIHIARHLSPFQADMVMLSEFLQCDTTPEAIAEALDAQTIVDRWINATRAGGVNGVIVDTGHPTPDVSLSPQELATEGVKAGGLLRIEQAAGQILLNASSFARFLEAFDGMVEGARQNGYCGFKSIIAYRSGLHIQPTDLSAAKAAFEIERTRLTSFLTEKHLLDFLFIRMLKTARRDQMSIQLHCGYGDADVTGELGNPMMLKPLLDSGEAHSVYFVILHGAYPHTAKAAWLAAVYPNIILDICNCIPPIAATELFAVWRSALAVAPSSQLQASSDAGTPEQVYLGARTARRILSLALGELSTIGGVPANIIDKIAVDALHRTAQRIYFDQELI